MQLGLATQVQGQGLRAHGLNANFVHVMQFLARNGFYMLIDDHSEDKTWQDFNAWINAYRQVPSPIAIAFNVLMRFGSR